MTKPEFGDIEPSSSKKPPEPVETANMLIARKNREAAAALRRRHNMSNMLLDRQDGLWYPSTLPVKDYELWNLYCRRK